MPFCFGCFSKKGCARPQGFHSTRKDTQQNALAKAFFGWDDSKLWFLWMKMDLVYKQRPNC